MLGIADRRVHELEQTENALDELTTTVDKADKYLKGSDDHVLLLEEK